MARRDEVLAVVLGAVEAQGLDVTDEDAAQVIDGLLTTSTTSARSGPAPEPSGPKLPPRAGRGVVHCCHQRREVVHNMNDCCHGTLEVAGR